MTSSGPTTLSTEVLERFRAALKTANALLGDEIEAGISDDEIDQLATELGVGVPPELRTLWKWGRPSADARRRDAGWDINRDFQLWSPTAALEGTRYYRSLMPELGPYIAFAGPRQGGCLIIRGDHSAVSPVIEFYVEDSDPVDEAVAIAPSLGAVFELFANELEAGAFKYVGDRWEPWE